jgi:hypothetical protein
VRKESLRRTLFWLPAVCPLILLTACPGGTPDLTVTSVEVTQAIQTPTNTIQLVALRGLAVRATIGVSGVSGPVSGVTGRLHVSVNGSEVTPAAGIAPIGALNAPASPQRANENDTLNFELPAPTSITASGDVDFRVDVTPVSGETNTGNNSGSANNLTFVNRTEPLLFFTRINYTPSGLGLPANSFIQPGTGDAFVKAILPVNDADPTLYQQGLFPSLTFTEDANSDGKLEALGTDGNDLISLLASCRQLIVNSGVGSSDRIFLFGWLAGNPINGNGLAQIGGRNAFGNTDPVRGQRSYAHELTHNFGLDHNTRSLDQVGWDVGGRLANNPASNNTTGRVKPTTLKDIQVAGLLTNQAFVDTQNYNFLLSSGTLAASPDASPDKPTNDSVLVVRGIFNPEGTELLRFPPSFRYPWASVAPRPPREGNFLVQVADVTGAITKVPFNARVADDSKEGMSKFGFFEVPVPVTPGRAVASVRITDKDGRREFGALKTSKPPTIRVTAPAAGAQLGPETKVTWEARDPDTAIDKLMYQVAYSPDAGRTFVPIAVDVPGSQTSITFNSTEIQKSSGTGIIRVFVSDGLNTAFADAAKLSAGAAKY